MSHCLFVYFIGKQPIRFLFWQPNEQHRARQKFGKRFAGYSPLELLQIEHVFLKGCGYEMPFHHSNKKPHNPTDKDILFNGLSAVVTFLCKLDNIPDVMDPSTLFNYKTSVGLKALA